MQPAKDRPANEAQIVESLGELDAACQALLEIAARVSEQIEPWRGNPLLDTLARSLAGATLFVHGTPAHVQRHARAARSIAAAS